MKLGRVILGLAAVSVSVAPLAGQDGLDGYMRHLAQQGNVQIVNGTVAAPGLHALTRFELSFRANWDYELTLEKSGSEFYLSVKPTMKTVDVSVRHTLKLPEGEEQKSARYRTLLLHEYDHVAISTDGRVKALLKGVISKVGTLRKRWTGVIPPPADQVNALIAAELELRKNAVVALVADAYQRLDRETDHGRRPLAHRANFFLPLFHEKHLEETKFPYMTEAKSALGSADFRTAPQYYRF